MMRTTQFTRVSGVILMLSIFSIAFDACGQDQNSANASGNQSDKHATVQADLKTAQERIEQNMNRVLQRDIKTLSNQQRNAVAEGLYLLYAANPDDADRLKKLRDGLKLLMDALPSDMTAPTRLLALCDQFAAVDSNQWAEIAARSKRHNLFFSVARVQQLLRYGQIVQACKLALAVEKWDSCTLGEEEGLSDLHAVIQLESGIKSADAAVMVWTAYTNAHHLESLYKRRLLFSLRQLYAYQMQSPEELMALVSFRIQFMHAMIHEASLLLDVTDGMSATYDVDGDTKLDIVALSGENKLIILKKLDSLSEERDYIRDLNRAWLLYNVEDITPTAIEDIIRNGQVAFLKKLPAKK